MTLTFKSTYGNNENKNIIEFKARLEKTIEDGFNVFVFEEKRNNKTIKNRIEFNDETINIYSGPSTLILELNKKIKNLFETEVANTYIWTYLKSIKQNENKVEFQYEISASEDFKDANHFLLELEWSE